MGKAIAGFLLGLLCLFLFSLTWGAQVFSNWEKREAAEVRLEGNGYSGSPSLSERERQGKKIRLAMNSFDLANGLTFQELEDFSGNYKYRFAAFLSLIASLGLVALLRKPKSY